MSPEQELFEAIWRAMRACKVTCDDPLLFIGAVTAAARAYAAGDSDRLTRARQMILRDGKR